MNLLRLHLWREWREHRMALLMLMLALPLVAFGVARVPPRSALADPLLQSGAALAFAVIVLVATGGELLGCDRRGPGLRWLERLPSGLGTAFLAKLLFLVLTTTLAAVYGLGVARSAALLRGVAPRALHWEPISFVAAVSLVIWTFACSAWALRGGVAILAAMLVLSVVGYPVWETLTEGYEPRAAEIWTLGSLLALGGLAGAALAFLRGGRLGRGTGKATVLGLAPIVPLLGVTSIWSLDHFQRRERLVPGAHDFYVHETLLTDDGRHAFLFVSHDDPRWREMPIFALDVDLADGSWKRVGRHFLHSELTSEPDETGLYRPIQLSVWTDEREEAHVFELSTGAPASRVERNPARWLPMGLGQWVLPSTREKEIIRDPFRRRDYPTSTLPFWKSRHETDVLVRDGRWLCREQWHAPWVRYDPDTRASEPLDLQPFTQVLALLPDGRVVLDPPEGAVYVLDPDTGAFAPIEASDTLQVFPNDYFFTEPGRSKVRCSDVDRPVVLTGLSWGPGLHVLDGEAKCFRFMAFGYIDESYVFGLPDERALLLVNRERLVALDLHSGERTPLFPLDPAN